ncbi:uncharacterized protein LOC119160740 isoform X2 [Rhipicephalus microplus]|uniref:uncharacterized protein LOC119160740 isoform X2 n=1 Tax=Rhipicephalus microplus TaxID=6941 RepID=UPI003F6B753F
MPPQPLCSKISLSKSVTLHTDLGDIKVELFCEACPKTTEVRRLLQCLLHFVWWEWREDLLRKSSLQHHLQGLQFSVFPRRCGRKPRGTRSAVTAANGMMDGVFAANETGAPRGEGERLYPVFRDWSTALDSSAGEKTTTMAASSTATSRASWCRQATLQVREKEVRASGVKTSPTKFRMDSRYNPSCAIEGRAEASFNLWCHLAFQRHSVRGVVSMANNGPNTNASQFFITYAKQPHLDQKYTVFGKVIDGLDTLEELEKVPVNPKYRPLRDIKLNSVTIHANPFAE